MRKLVVIENLALDGVMEAPEKWAFPYHGEDIAEANQAGMGASDAMLFGRVTYEEFAAFWPFQTGDESGIASYLNRIPKYVVSSTLRTAEWSNSTLISTNVVEEITRLKQQPGGNIGIVGSGTLVRSLINYNLIDRLSLYVHPLVLGSGKLLFAPESTMKALKLVETKIFSKGVVLLTYEPDQRG
jgi:dihydrofolate reductase